MNIEVNAQKVIDNLLEQNKQLTLEIAVLRARLDGVQDAPESPQAG